LVIYFSFCCPVLLKRLSNPSHRKIFLFLLLLLATSTHLRYKYPKFKAREESIDDGDDEEGQRADEKGRRKVEEKDRYFWDGAYLSNTPF
jgi:hypothetical protein